MISFHPKLDKSFGKDGITRGHMRKTQGIWTSSAHLLHLKDMSFAKPV